MEFINFTDLVIDKSGGNKKLPQSSFAKEGLYPIIDQSQKFIAGYTDDVEFLFKSTNLPVVVFGDHTKAIKFIDFPFVMGADGVKILKPKENCDVKYLYHYLRFVKIPDAGYSRHFKFLKEIEIPLPPISEQKRIADILDKADELRQKRQQSIAKLDELLQATFIDMFGDPVTNPKGWEVKKIKDVIKSFTEKDNFVDEDLIWLLNLDMVQSDTGEILGKNLVKYADLNASTRYFNEKTVLYSKLRPYLNKVVIPKENGYCTTELVVLQPNEIFINRYFLAYYLRSSEFLNWANLKVAGAKMPRLNMTDFWQKEIYIPPLEVQNKFAILVEKIETQKQLLTQQLHQQNQLFQSLQHQAFNGTL